MSERVLVIGPSWVGDMIMAQALFKAILANQPHATIDVLAPKWCEPILARMPEVTHSFIMPVGHGRLQIKKRYQIARELRAKQYQQAVVLPNSFKSSLIPWFAGIAKRTGWLGECRFGLLNDWRRLDKKQYPLMVERYVALAFAPNSQFSAKTYWPKLVVNQEECEATQEKFLLSSDKPILMCCPGAEFGPSKRWPAKYYAQLVKYYIEQGGQAWLMGGPKDKPVISEIMRLVDNHCVDLSDTSLAEAIDLMSLADVVVSNDSGLMHMAAALDRKVVAIFGSTSPQFTPPLCDNAHVVSLELPCKPCFKRDCPLGHHRCMRDIKPEMIIDKL